jgi:ribosomal protein L37AE/L43A
MKRTDEIIRRVRRTKEEIAESMKDRSVCYRCGEKLKKVSVQRTSAKLCGSCRGDGKSDNSLIKQLQKELKSQKIEPSEDEMSFEDDPKALKEQDHVRYISKPTEHISHSTSALVEMMSPSTSHHHYKRGSATKGTRYTYRKGKVE